MFKRTTRAMFALVAALALVAGCDSSKSKASGDKSGAAQASAEQESGEEGEEHADDEHHDDHHEGEGHADDDHHDDHHEGEGHADDEHHDDHHDDEGDEQAAKGEGEMVDVPKDGKKFDPSVKASQIPEGAWHCNMKGKVHYAAQKKGNGECPVCGMDLKEK